MSKYIQTKIFLFGSLFMLYALLAAPIASAQTGLTENQIKSIVQLLSSFGADQQVIANVTATLEGRRIATTQYPADPSVSTSSIPTGKVSNVPVFTHVMKMGETGVEVRSLQLFLRIQGYFGSETTGYFGNATSQALAAFQKAHGLQAVGFVGPQTISLLNSIVSGALSSPR